MSQQLRNKIALVIGGRGAIGAATAQSLVAAGARVLTIDRPERVGAETAISAQASSGPQSISTYTADICDANSLAQVRQEIANDCEVLHVLVNASGFTKTVPHANLEALDDALIDDIFRVNWRGQFAAIRSFAPLLKASGDGLIVSVSSIAGSTGIGSNIAYCAAKAGIDVMTRSLARVLAPEIRVLAVSPGVVDTDFVPGRNAAFNSRVEATTPLHRIASANDVADAILACVTNLRYSTGHTIQVDGGRSL